MTFLNVKLKFDKYYEYNAFRTFFTLGELFCVFLNMAFGLENWSCINNCFFERCCKSPSVEGKIVTLVFKCSVRHGCFVNFYRSFRLSYFTFLCNIFPSRNVQIVLQIVVWNLIKTLLVSQWSWMKSKHFKCQVLRFFSKFR